MQGTQSVLTSDSLVFIREDMSSSSFEDTSSDSVPVPHE